MDMNNIDTNFPIDSLRLKRGCITDSVMDLRLRSVADSETDHWLIVSTNPLD